MLLLPAATLVILHAHLALALRGCCHPDRMMGQAFLVEEQKTLFFAVDFPAGRFYRTADKSRNWYNIVDFIEKKSYTSHDGSCSVTDVPDISDQVQCMTAGQNVGTFQLGNERQGSFVDAFSYLLSGKPVWKTVSYQADNVTMCYPVTVHAKEERVNRTIVYSNIKPFIDFNEIYDSFDDCKQQSKREYIIAY